MNTNDPKSSQDPKQPYSDPNKPYPRDPVIPTQSAQPSRSTEPSKTYSTDASRYVNASKSASAEPRRIYAEQEESSKTYSGDFKSSSDYTQKDKDYHHKESKDYHHKESIEDKVRDSFRNIKDSKKVDELYHYAQHNKEQTITYILLVLGLILLFFDTLLGGLMIGMVAGYHFAQEIIYYLRNIGQVFAGQDQLRYAVLTGLLLGLFIAAPGIFVGAVIVAAFKQVMSGKGERPSTDRHNGSDKPKDRF